MLATEVNEMSENTINIYMGAEDKVNVKDATQIIKLQGPKGDPGPKGEDGEQGPKGDPLRFEDLTEAQKLELKGEQGPKGEPFKYTDFTEEQLAALKGERGEKGETGERGRKGPQGDNVNLETVAKIKNLLLDNNVFVKSDSLEGILLEFITAQANSVNFVKDDGVYEPYIKVSEGMVQITYLTSLPFQINDGEVQYMEGQNVERPLPSTTENTTIKFYNARMKLMYTKIIEATL